MEDDKNGKFTLGFHVIRTWCVHFNKVNFFVHAIRSEYFQSVHLESSLAFPVRGCLKQIWFKNSTVLPMTNGFEMFADGLLDFIYLNHYLREGNNCKINFLDIKYVHV